MNNLKDVASSNIKHTLMWFGANDYEPESTERLISSMNAAVVLEVKSELRQIIDKRLWSQRFYLGLTGFEFETEDGFYTYLEEVWQYVFNDGPLPDVKKYWY